MLLYLSERRPHYRSGMSEKHAFSDRLRAAMQALGLPVRPTVVEREFNKRWPGQPVSPQAAWNWLNARAVPSQDKLLVLAEWLHVEPEVLRFGERVRHTVQEHRQRWGDDMNYAERETVDLFLQLPDHERRLIREVILALAGKRHAQGQP